MPLQLVGGAAKVKRPLAATVANWLQGAPATVGALMRSYIRIFGVCGKLPARQGRENFEKCTANFEKSLYTFEKPIHHCNF